MRTEPGIGSLIGGTKRTDEQSAIWIVSFGDLLTLLLCFFLLALSLSPLNPAVRRTINNSETYLDKSVTTKASSAAPGTPLANSKIEGGDLTLLKYDFAPEDFLEPSGALSASGLEKAKRIVVPGGWKVRSVSIELCGPQSGEGASADYSAALNKAMAIRRQLFDAGFERSGLRLSANSEGCSTAKVSLELRRFKNG